MNLIVQDKDFSCRTKDHFWFQEVKQAILAIVNEGYTLKDVERECKENNFFDAASPSRAREIWLAVHRRLENTPTEFLEFFTRQNVEDQKLLVLILILNEDRTFFEFMNNVYKEKLIVGDDELLDSQILGFIHDIQNTEPRAASWTDASMKKMRTNMKGIMRDSGIIRYADKKMILVRPIITEGFRTFLEGEGQGLMIKILAGER